MPSKAKTLFGLRLDKGLTRRELANRALLNEKTIARIEQGHIVSELTKAKLAKALGVPIRQLEEPASAPDR